MNQSFLNAGKQKEIDFAECLIRNKGGSYRMTTKEEDIRDHVDLYWNDKYGFDVKGIKKNHRHDDNYDDSIHYVEMLNVRGDLGWLYGKASYFAFETTKSWVVVEKSRLIQFVEEKVDMTIRPVIYTEDFYQCQTRRNRSDLFTKVRTEDLVRISNLILEK